MHVLDHDRWHVTLALAGALLIHFLPWQLAALLVGTIALEHGLRTGYTRAPEIRPDHALDAGPDQNGVERRGRLSAFVAMRLPMPLVRLFGAKCALCEGVGCGDCANIGLRLPPTTMIVSQGMHGSHGRGPWDLWTDGTS